MKKILAIMLTVVFFGCCVAYADTDEEILFRDIPWGIGIDEVKNALSDFGLWRDVKGCNNAHWSYKDPNTRSLTENGYQGGCKNSNDEEPFEVEGYPCYILVYCAYGLDDNGKVLRDRKSSEFYMASYNFDTKNIDTELAYEDFKEKLSELYGAGEETTSNSEGAILVDNDTFSFQSTIMLTEWIGANNTAVLLRAEWDTKTNLGISLVIAYGRTDYDSQLTEIENAIEKK